MILGWLACASAPEGSIAFVFERDGVPEVHVIAPSESASRPLEDLPSPAWPAAADPRGGLFVLTEPGEEVLWRVPPEGPPIRLASAATLRNPAVSPDGAWVTFEADTRSFRDLYRVSRDGGEPERLTDAPHGSFEPSLSADGTRMVFGTSRDGNAEVWTSGADGTAPRRITNHARDDVRPRFGPNGSLVFLSSRDGTPRVWIADDDGSDVRALREPDGGVDVDYALSPVGDRLAVVVQRGPGEAAIELWDLGGALVATLDGHGIDEQPAFSPDGRLVVFVSARNGDPDLWLAGSDGADVRRLTSDPAAEWLPRWLR